MLIDGGVLPGIFGEGKGFRISPVDFALKSTAEVDLIVDFVTALDPNDFALVTHEGTARLVRTLNLAAADTALTSTAVAAVTLAAEPTPVSLAAEGLGLISTAAADVLQSVKMNVADLAVDSAGSLAALQPQRNLSTAALALTLLAEADLLREQLLAAEGQVLETSAEAALDQFAVIELATAATALTGSAAADLDVAFDPSKLTNLTLWWRSTDNVTVQSGKVSSWVDKIDSLEIAQSDAGDRPVYIASESGINNYPALEATGGVALTTAEADGDNLTLFDYINSDSSAVIMLINESGTSFANPVFSLKDPSQTNRGINLIASLNDLIYFDHGTTSASTSGGRTTHSVPGDWDGNWHVLIVYRTSGNTQVTRIDGVDEGSDTRNYTLSATTSAGVALFETVAGANAFAGKIAEVMVLDSISTGDITNLESYFNDRYGLSI